MHFPKTIAIVVVGAFWLASTGSFAAQSEAATPSVQIDPEIWGAAMVGDLLRAHAGEWSTDSPTEYEIDWLRCDGAGQNCVSEAGPALDAQGRLLVSPGDIGDRFRARVTATNASGTSEATSPATPAVVDRDSPEVLGQPEIVDPSGSIPVPGLEVGVFNWDADWYPWRADAPDSYFDGPEFDGWRQGISWQWTRCDTAGEDCVQIPGADTPVYVFAPADVGHTVRATVTGTTNAGSVSITADPTSVVEQVEAPVIEAPIPAPFQGAWWSYEDPHEGNTLQHAGDAWGPHSGLNGGFELSGREHAWLRCDVDGDDCVEIPGATTYEYRMQTADVGSRLRVRVTATNAAGQATETSAASDVVLPIEAPEITIFPWEEWEANPMPIGGPHYLNAPWGLNPGAGASSEVGTIQWERCDPQGGNCALIDGATSSEYKPTAADSGHTLRFHVVAENSAGTDAAQSDPSVVLGDAIPIEAMAAPTIDAPEHPALRETIYADASEIWSGGYFGWELQWQRCDAAGGSCEDIPGRWDASDIDYDAWGTGYTPRERDVGYRLRVKVSKPGPNGEAVAASEPTGVVESDASPLNLTVPEIIGPARARERFSTSGGTWSPSSAGLEYQWLRCDAQGEECSEIEDADGSSYDSSAADLGSSLRVRVTASNAVGSTSSESDPTAVLSAPAVPESVSAPQIEGEPTVGETLSGTEGDWHGARPLGFSYRWLRCDSLGDGCVPLTDETDNQLAVDLAEMDRTLRFEVTAANDLGATTVRSTPSPVIGPPGIPTNVSLPTIDGQPTDTVPLTGAPGSWDSAAPVSFSYQWIQCDAAGEACSAIVGADSQVYTPGAIDIGKTLRVRVQADNGFGTTQATSDASEPVEGIRPWFADPVTIDGSLHQGDQLEANVEGARGTQPVDFAYAWRRCDVTCQTIPGATAEAYELTAADVGFGIRLKVTAQNDWGMRSSSSSEHGPVLTPSTDPKLLSGPRLVGLPRVTETLEFAGGTWSGTEPLDTNVQWQRCSGAPPTCQDVPAAVNPEYELTTADEGMSVRVVLTASNSAGSSSVASNRTPSVRPAVNTLFVLDELVPFSDVADGVSTAGAPMVSFDRGGATSGVLSLPKGADVSEVSAYVADLPGPGGVQIRRFSLRGNVPTQALGAALRPNVAHRKEVPSLYRSASSEEQPPQGGEQSGSDWRHSPVSAAAFAAFDPVVWNVFDPDVEPFGTVRRYVGSSFTWTTSQQQVQDTISEHGQIAMEFDVKLINDNWGGVSGIICLPGDRADFWIDARDGVYLHSPDIPDEAGLYWDTDVSDGCNEKDLAWGIYHPEVLEENATYTVDVFFVGNFFGVPEGWGPLLAVGDEENSVFEWAIQFPEHDCGPFPESPNCIGLDENATQGLPIVPASAGFTVPDCWLWQEEGPVLNGIFFHPLQRWCFPT